MKCFAFQSEMLPRNPPISLWCVLTRLMFLVVDDFSFCCVIDITAVIITVFLSLIGVYAQHIFTFLAPPEGNVCIAHRPVLGFPRTGEKKRIMWLTECVWQFVCHEFLWPAQHIWYSVVLLSKHSPCCCIVKSSTI